MKQQTLKYRVAPINPASPSNIPYDMLRYDGAYPADQIASGVIEARAHRENHELRSVELVTTFNGSPNDARWRSFGWHVTHVWNGYEWTPYVGSMRGHTLKK